MKGLEPSTFCMASRRSSQLSYIRGEGKYRSAARPARELPAGVREAQRGPRISPGAALWSGIRVMCCQLPTGGEPCGGPFCPDMCGQ